MLRKLLSAAGLASLAAALTQAVPAAACGSLIAPNGSVRLTHAATLVAWHDGVEHYLTNFSYAGNVPDVGYIIPLPAVPVEPVKEGGDWTLQRLFRETHPAPLALDFFAAGHGQAAASSASNHFVLDQETREHLLAYAKGSPIFLAAKYDLSRARQQGLLFGDGTPVLITMKTAHPWIPLEVLAIDGQQTQADLYLLTDQPLNTSALGAMVGQSAVGQEVPGAPGLRMAFQESMNASLFHDLSTDKNMGWVPTGGWLSYLTLDAAPQNVTYDLSVTPMGVVKLAPFGTAPMAIVDGPGGGRALNLPTAPVGTPLAILLVLLLAEGAFLVLRRS
ncbi:MAG: hypothetical protein E6I70_12750 [Chloroflexi bacterium]|nr:MAG: hypothetical protein E6I70_12750 [Chloroflexota bacterium]